MIQKLIRQNSRTSQITRVLNVSVVLAIVLVGQTIACANHNDDEKDDLRLSRANQLRALSAGDEAFTEPIETIKIASAESGIVGKVKIKRGDTVGVDDLLFELDMSVLEASKRLASAKANSKARLKAAKVEYEAKTKRYKKLVTLREDGAGSAEEVEKAQTDAEVARQSVEAIIEENEQAALETKRIESQMELRRVRTPIQGIVIDVRKKEGEYVASSDPHLATIVQLETLRVVFYLPTSRVSKIKQGDNAELLLTETKQHAKGLVEYVAPITNADSGRVRVEVLIPNDEGAYRSGVRCRVLEVFAQQSMLDEPSQARKK
jgi:RND family efflux transporter MFP subunit